MGPSTPKRLSAIDLQGLERCDSAMRAPGSGREIANVRSLGGDTQAEKTLFFVENDNGMMKIQQWQGFQSDFQSTVSPDEIVDDPRVFCDSF